MLTVVRDPEGRLDGVVEWWLVDEHGERASFGQYVWVNQLELNLEVESVVVIRQMIEQIQHAAPYAVGAYWERRERSGHKLHAFRRGQLIKHLEEVRV